MHFALVVKRVPFAILMGLMACKGQAPQPSNPPQIADQERVHLQEQLERHESYLSSAMWSLAHSADSEKEVEEFANTFAFLGPPKFESGDAPVTEVKTVGEFKSRIVAFIESKDDVVCATAAVVVGAIGDTTYVSRLVAELRSTVVRRSQAGEQLCRGRAAMALGLLQAKEYASALVPLLRSKNPYDRAGAAQGLGLMKATEYKEAVGALLGRLHGRGMADADLSDQDDDSAITALLEMGVGSEYAPEFALIIREPSGDEARRAAMFALARVGAREHTATIAGLLDDEFEKGHAAIALGVLREQAYTKRIAGLLKSGSPLHRKDAALALALSNATETTDDIAILLSSREDYTRYYGAVALTVLDPHKYSSRILPIVQPYHSQGYRLNKGDLHHLLSKEYAKLEKQFLDNLKAIELK